MPTYEYFCDKCDKIIDIFHSMNDDPVRICPECENHGLQKLISAGMTPIVKGTQTPCTGGPKKKRDINLEKLGRGKNKLEEKPWWRPKDKVNKKILNNPEKYIEKGEV